MLFIALSWIVALCRSPFFFFTMDTMNNQKFYVRQTTTPGTVKIETHYKGEGERRRPLTDVADLIQGILSTFIPQ